VGAPQSWTSLPKTTIS
jgi:tRNA(fMet)-specific endonuclease VapC